MSNYYINLDGAIARQTWMEEQFRKIGVTAERVRAVTPGTIPDESAGLTIGNAMERAWIETEIACFLSHRECWKRIAGGLDRFGAVFEDDMHFCEEAGAYLRDISWIPEGVGLIKLETLLAKTHLSRQGLAAGGRTLRQLESIHLGAGAYVMSRDIARWLLERSRRIDVPVDHLLFAPGTYCPEATPWQLCPAICIQDNRLNPDNTRLVSQISDSHRGIRARATRPSRAEKILLELLRPLRQAQRIAQDPARLTRPWRKVVPFR